MVFAIYSSTNIRPLAEHIINLKPNDFCPIYIKSVFSPTLGTDIF
jgi:hypothetical protein